MSDGDPLAELYAALEAEFRGSSEEIRRRQEVYVPDVLPLRDTGLPFLDIGPGRGEWLSLLRDNGIPAYGVDANRAFAEQGRAAGLDVRLGDAAAHLAECDEASLCGVSAFHVAEHVSFDMLVTILDGAVRALAPGGLLLLETPNPLNVVVGSATFWIDPTHRHPLHPQMLRFLVEQRGFVDAEVRVVNPPRDPPLPVPEAPEALVAAVRRLNEAFFSGLDYAVLARRPAAAG